MTQAANLAALGSNTNTTGILPAAGGGTAGTGGVIGFKNRIINGNMVVSQYNGSSSVTPNNQYFIDRFQYQNSATGKLTFQQNAGSVTPPTGFANYMGITSSSAYTPTSGQLFCISTIVEGYNCADFAYGTASAQSITLSFWIRSSVTGTFSGSVQFGDQSYSYPFSYTVNSANTWEQKSITIPGNTSASLPGTNNAGMRIFWDMGSGSTFKGTANSWQSGNYCGVTGAANVIGTNAATWYMTGAQLEVGSTATNFDVRSYGTELALCQRYAYKFGSSVPYNGGFYTSTQILATIIFPVTMRATPTYTAGTATAFYNGGSTSVTPSQNQQSVNSGLLTLTGATSTAGYSAAIISNNDLFSAEL